MLTIQVPDMTCGGCAGRIAKAIAGVDALARTEVDLRARRISVTSTASEPDLLAAIRDAGYSPAVAGTSTAT
jgi:copper chaperone